MNILRSPSLHGRLSLVLTTLIAVMMMIGAGVWLRETRQAIHEEVEAATRVAIPATGGSTDQRPDPRHAGGPDGGHPQTHPGTSRAIAPRSRPGGSQRQQRELIASNVRRRQSAACSGDFSFWSFDPVSPAPRVRGGAAF